MPYYVSNIPKTKARINKKKKQRNKYKHQDKKKKKKIVAKCVFFNHPRFKYDL